jgi:hypothetical protein
MTAETYLDLKEAVISLATKRKLLGDGESP